MKKEKNVANRDGFLKMNFLLQASVLISEKSQVLSREYIKQMKKVARKNVLRIDPYIKRSICKTCNSFLLCEQNGTMKIKKRQQKSLEIKCKSCSDKRVFVLNPQHLLAAESVNENKSQSEL